MCGYQNTVEIVEIEVPVDHIHMVVRTEHKVSPLDILQIIKSITAREFFRLHPDIQKKYFWGGKLWTQSYFVETMGHANEKVIRAYVQNQLKFMDIQETRATQLKRF